MKNKFNLLVAFLLFISASAQTSDLEKPLPFDPNVRTGTLPNGLKYFIRKNSRPEKRAELRLAVNTGSTMENDDQQGLAHFCEHMAFNGTKNFKKNELVDYLESIGTKFGPHLNAYTSFDETVYMLRVPTDSEVYVNKGMQILEDWAHNLSFDTVEINKERGVVIEEWRLGQGADERMRNKYWPVLFKNSRYEVRLPIGKPDILKNCSYDKLISFYKDFYRPDNMAVILVGDFDVDRMEQKIKDHFTNIQNPVNERKVESWQVPDHKELRIAKATDKEAAYTIVEILYNHDKEKFITESDYRKHILYDLYNGMFQNRLAELQQKSDPPFSFASTSFGSFVRTKSMYSSFAMVKEQGIEKGLQTLVEENERVRRFGFSSSELEREKKSVMRRMESSFAEKDKTESAQITNEYIRYFLEEEPSPGIELELGLYKKYLGGITVDEINQLAKKWINPNGENCGIIIQAPEKKEVNLPEEIKIQELFSKVSTLDLKPYDDKFSDRPLIAKMPVSGKIISEKNNTEFGFTEMQLSNGAKVFYKKTDFKNDQVVFSAQSFGGSGLYPVSDDASAGEASGILMNSGAGDFDQTQLKKSLQGKIANVYCYISETMEGMGGFSSPKDLETLMQLIYLRFTAPRKDADGFNSHMEQMKGYIQNRSADPEEIFSDTIEVTMSNYHPRRKPTTMESLKEINHDRAFEIYKDRFADASDFNFVFVGNMNTDEFKKMCEQYLASLPALNRKETWKDVGVTPPSGKISKTVKRGVEPKSSVSFKFHGNAVYSLKENLDMQALIKLMQILLRESLREEKGGTYGVQCYGYISRVPRQEYTLNVAFGCAPENVQKLTDAVYAEIDKVKKNGCDEKNMVKIKETFRRDRETNLRENNYWSQRIMNIAMFNDKLLNQDEFDDYLKNLNSADLKRMAEKYFNLDDYGYFVLYPEKEKGMEVKK
ncbi:MAG: M16 family metallopeptidase [Bacteroidia bacterium]